MKQYTVYHVKYHQQPSPDAYHVKKTSKKRDITFQRPIANYFEIMSCASPTHFCIVSVLQITLWVLLPAVESATQSLVALAIGVVVVCIVVIIFVVVVVVVVVAVVVMLSIFRDYGRSQSLSWSCSSHLSVMMYYNPNNPNPIK